ncbi:MAG: (Fe-S)-binding protein [Chloroflexota bacterium]
MPQTQYLIDDYTWEKLLELTDGAAAVCFQCGVCTATCPWGLVKQEALSVRSYLRGAQVGIQKDNDNLWLCTTCAQCEAYCPRGVRITDVFRGLRYLTWEQKHPHKGLSNLLWSVFWNNNPWEQPPSQRNKWGQNLNIPIFNPEQHEILYYVGCTASYDTRAQKIARSMVHLLNVAEVSFGTLGEDEPCSGEEVLSVGHTPYFREIANHCAQVFSDRGITHLITTDPHSYDVFQHHYPNSGRSNLLPHHYTQYFVNLLEDGRLQFNKPVERKITFHDPCYLSRHNSEIKAPRQVLDAIPGVELVEMKNVGVDTLCCGGGGGRMWLETEVGERFSDLRVKEALECGADILATACPYCVTCLEDSLKSQGIQTLSVMDIAEIAALALE